MNQDQDMQDPQDNPMTKYTAAEPTRRGPAGDTPKGLDATQLSEKYAFGKIKSAAGPLITAILVFVVAGVLMSIGVAENAAAYRGSPSQGFIIFGVLVGAIALTFFLVTIWRLAQQFFEMYSTATRGKPHPEL